MGRPGSKQRPRSEILQSVAANVAMARTSAGLSQEALAEAADIPHRAIRRLETAEVESGFVTLVAVARALGVTVDTLLKPARFTRRSRGRPKSGKST